MLNYLLYVNVNSLVALHVLCNKIFTIRASHEVGVASLKLDFFFRKKEKIQSLSIYRPLNEGYDFGNQAYQDALSTLGINIHTVSCSTL